MKIGKDVLKISTTKRKKVYVRKIPYARFLSEIEQIKAVESIDIIRDMIKNAHLKRSLNDTEYEVLCSLLSKKASEVGEKKRAVKLGPLGEFGVEKKGKL